MKRLLLASTMLVLPFAAHATPITWTGATSNAWETATNWVGNTVPTATSAVTISNLTNNPVQLNSNVSLSGLGGALIVGTGTAPGTANTLNINLGDTLTLGTKPVTLAGGSVTGPGTLSMTTGAISGFGTISSQILGTSFTANSTNGNAFGGFSPFVNGTPGTPITLIGQSNLASDTFSVANHGNFDFQGVTLTTPTLNGVSTNLNAGSVGGNNYYGLFDFTGANSTVVGTVNNTNYQQFGVTGTTLSLSNFKLANTWATNVPQFFVVGAGGTVDNIGGSVLNGHMTNTLAGGAITNSANDPNFAIAGQVNGFGTLSGPAIVTGGIVATGGTLTVDATKGTGGITAASAGWTATAGSVLDLKGNINFAPALSFPAAPALSPGGGTLQLDGATINTTGDTGTLQTGTGLVNVASGVNTLNGSFIPNGSNGGVANYNIGNGATLSLQNLGAGPAITGNNFTMAQGSALTVGAGNDAISLAGNFSFQPTDTWTFNGIAGLGPDLIMTGGTTLNPVTLEVGGVNDGYSPAGFVDNFALHSLTIGAGANVALADQFAGASLYLDGLFDGPGGTLNLDGIATYLTGYGELQNGIFTDPQGDTINIIGAPVPVAEPSTLALLGFGIFGIGIGVAHRRRQSVAA